MMVTFWSLGNLRRQRKAPWIWCMVGSHDIYLSICLSVCLPVFPSVYLYIYLSGNLYINLEIYLAIYLSVYLSIFPSINLSLFQSIYLSIYQSVHMSIYLSIYLSVYQSLSIYPSVYVYLDNSIIEMLFDHDWSEILLQKTLLNQRGRICCLNLNWWNNLNLILTLSNFWDALPSLVNTEKFNISIP